LGPPLFRCRHEAFTLVGKIDPARSNPGDRTGRHLMMEPPMTGARGGLSGFLIAALLVLGASASHAETRVIRIGTEAAYPPFASIAPDGEFVGFDIDIARALCAAARVECEIENYSFDGLIPGLDAKQFDAIIASMAITEERRKVVDFTDKYYVSPGRFVAQKDANIEISPAGLADKVACVQGASIHESYFRDSFPDVETRTYGTQQEAVLDLIAGRCDVLLGEALSLDRDLLQTPEGDDFTYIGPTVSDPRWYGEGAGIAVRKGDSELVALFNAAIKQIRADGTYARINDKYFDFDIYGE
jgi:lysine-arginine-ornithine-binding protein